MTRIAFGLGALALLAGCVAPPAMTQAEFEQLQNEIELAQTRLVEADALTTFRGFLIALQDRGYQVRAVHPEGLILEADRAGRTAVAIAFVPQGPRRTAVRVAAESRSPFAPAMRRSIK